ncbi:MULTISPECIES: hypothetical protein [unclassified Microbacterium]|uniref:hypothetical protein n=1 Tax=unclassified Microbacterium TaxID=2609290 RepID=UPI00300FC141
MSTQHIVTAAAAKVSVGGAGGNRVAVLLRRGDVVPEGVSEESLKHLTDRGLIEAVDVDEAAEDAEVVDEGIYKGVSVKDLKAEIDKRNSDREDAAKVVPAEPGNRPQIVAALLADDAKQ